MKRPSEEPAAPAVLTGEGDRMSLEGALDVRTLSRVEESLAKTKHSKSAALDLRHLVSLDTPGALFLCELREKGMELTGVRREHQGLIELVCSLDLAPLPKPKHVPRWRELVIRLGEGAIEVWDDTLEVVTFVGRSASALGHALFHPSLFRLPSISRHVEDTGLDALPIIGMMAVMISVVIGYQGVAQLRPYGGEEYTINLVAVSVLREMGVLITAIMVAGRSGSSFTAEIGVMKSREEVDALEVMGIRPMEVLVLPRIVGLMIALPLLTFFADILGLLGGAVICHGVLGVSFAQYFERVHRAVDGSDFFVGMLKSPIFAFAIATIGCMHGLRVKGSAESVGRETTRAVVKSIFLVIILDALFSVLFEELGI